MSRPPVAVRFTRLGTAIPTGVVALLMFAMSFVPPDGKAAGGTSQVVVRVSILAGSAFFGFVCVRALRGGVLVDEHQVLVRNIFQTVGVPLDAVDRFDTGAGLLGSGTCGVVVLRDGRELRATMLGGASELTDNSALRKVLDSLNRQLDEAQS